MDIIEVLKEFWNHLTINQKMMCNSSDGSITLAVLYGIEHPEHKNQINLIVSQAVENNDPDFNSFFDDVAKIADQLVELNNFRF